MAGLENVIMTGKWSVGYEHKHGLTLLLFEFSNRDPIRLAITRENAEQIAVHSTP